MNMKINNSGKIFGLFFTTTAWIAGPVLVGTIGGNWLIERFEMKSWWFLVFVGVSFLVSMFGLTRNALREFKNIEADSKNDEKE